MPNDRFYADLPVIDTFLGIVRPESYRPVPPDWHVLVADITQSTRAIEWGLYKHVNILGGACIISVLNVTGGVAIPFVFGGDGAIMCVPESLLIKAQDALLATKLMALKSFKLQLRIGSVPIGVLNAAGQDIKVTRYKVSKDSIQAVFAGGGIEYAEQMIKDKAPGAQVIELGGDRIPQADFKGLECRWQDIKSAKGEIVCLIAKSLSDDFARNRSVYEELLRKIEEIYGDEAVQHPLNKHGMKLTLNPKNLMGETLVRAPKLSWLSHMKYLIGLKLKVLLGMFIMRFGIKIGDTDWSLYKDTLIRNTDYRRFIESYRQLLAGTPDQREALTAYLEERYREGVLVYGVHLTDRALMTCLVFDYIGDHIHFLDGADGGFAVAARDMKERIKQLSRR